MVNVHHGTFFIIGGSFPSKRSPSDVCVLRAGGVEDFSRANFKNKLPSHSLDDSVRVMLYPSSI